MAHVSIEPRTRANPSLVGIGWKVASAFVFTVMLTLVRLLEDRVPVGQTLFFRNFLALLPVAAMIAFSSGSVRAAFVTRNPWGHAKRAFAGVVAMGLWFYALRHLTFPEATALIYAAPLILVVLAATVLGERVRVYRWSAVAVGFLGVLVTLYPQLAGGLDLGDQRLVAALAALGGATFMALASVFIRELTATESTGTIVLYFFIAASLMTLLTMPFGWVVPSPSDLAILLAIGVLGGIGQMMLTQAYRHAEASTVAPFEYTSMVWAVSFGIVVFGEVPTVHVIVGALILIASGLYVMHREQRLGIERRERNVGAPLRS